MLLTCHSLQLAVEPPSTDEREELLQRVLQRALDADAVVPAVKRLAQQTVGLLPREIMAVCADAGLTAAPPQAPTRLCLGRLSARQTEPAPPPSFLLASDSPSGATGASAAAEAFEKDADGAQGSSVEAVAPVKVLEGHLDKALALMRKRTATEVGAPGIASGTKWEDIGGLEHCKRAILDTVELPLRHRSLFRFGLGLVRDRCRLLAKLGPRRRLERPGTQGGCQHRERIGGSRGQGQSTLRSEGEDRALTRANIRIDKSACAAALGSGSALGCCFMALRGQGRHFWQRLWRASARSTSSA